MYSTQFKHVNAAADATELKENRGVFLPKIVKIGTFLLMILI